MSDPLSSPTVKTTMDEFDTRQSILQSYQNTLESLHKCFGTAITAQKLTMSPVIQATQHLQEVFSVQQNLEFDRKVLSSVERLQRYREPYTSILEQYRIFVADFSSSLKGVTDETLNAGVIRSFLENCGTHISSDALKSAFASARVTNSYVEVPDKAMETLNKTFKCPENSSVCNNSSGDKIHRISIRDFIITVILPVLCMIAPMLQNSYYHRLDVLEEKKSQIQEEQFQEQLLQLTEEHNQQIEELNSTITELLDYIQSLPEYPPVNQSTAEALSPDHKSPEYLSADQQSSSSMSDESDNHAGQTTSD